jgi:hypothetical protein
MMTLHEMTLYEIGLLACRTEHMRETLGDDQDDEHVWFWLKHLLELWERAHPSRRLK